MWTTEIRILFFFFVSCTNGGINNDNTSSTKEFVPNSCDIEEPLHAVAQACDGGQSSVLCPLTRFLLSRICSKMPEATTNGTQEYYYPHVNTSLCIVDWFPDDCLDDECSKNVESLKSLSTPSECSNACNKDLILCQHFLASLQTLQHLMSTTETITKEKDGSSTVKPEESTTTGTATVPTTAVKAEDVTTAMGGRSQLDNQARDTGENNASVTQDMHQKPLEEGNTEVHNDNEGKSVIEARESIENSDVPLENDEEGILETHLENFHPVKEESSFLSYFLLVFTVAIIIIYFVSRNKKKIIAALLEGRPTSGSRSRSRSSQYRKLDNNLEEAMADERSRDSISQVIY